MPTENELSGAISHHRTPRPSPTKVGNHKLSPQTLMLGYGFDPELSVDGFEAGRQRDVDRDEGARAGSDHAELAHDHVAGIEIVLAGCVAFCHGPGQLLAHPVQ